MKSLKVSILALVLIVVARAMAFTALKTASDLWYGALFAFTAVLPRGRSILGLPS